MKRLTIALSHLIARLPVWVPALLFFLLVIATYLILKNTLGFDRTAYLFN